MKIFFLKEFLYSSTRLPDKMPSKKKKFQEKSSRRRFRENSMNENTNWGIYSHCCCFVAVEEHSRLFGSSVAWVNALMLRKYEREWKQKVFTSFYFIFLSFFFSKTSNYNLLPSSIESLDDVFFQWENVCMNENL